MTAEERLLDAIREHRASHAPNAWSEADRRLYAHLPEVIASRAQEVADDDDA